MFARMAKWCFDRRRLVLVLWVFALIAANGIAQSVGDDYRQDFSLPGADSSKGFDLLEARFGGQATGQNGTVVFEAEQGVNDPQVKAGMEKLFAAIAKIEGVTRVESPYGPGGERLISPAGEYAGKIAFANVDFPKEIDFGKLPDIKDKILDAEPQIEGLRIELGGMIFAAFQPPTTETIGQSPAASGRTAADDS